MTCATDGQIHCRPIWSACSHWTEDSDRELVDHQLRLDSARKYAPVSGASGRSYGDLSTFIF